MIRKRKRNMVDLKETNIEDLENFDWVAYFEYNNAHLLK